MLLLFFSFQLPRDLLRVLQEAQELTIFVSLIWRSRHLVQFATGLLKVFICVCQSCAFMLFLVQLCYQCLASWKTKTTFCYRKGCAGHNVHTQYTHLFGISFAWPGKGGSWSTRPNKMPHLLCVSLFAPFLFVSVFVLYVTTSMR